VQRSCVEAREDVAHFDACSVGVGAVTRADLEFGTIPALVRASAERFPDLDGLIDGDLRMTFPELAARIEETSRAFMAAGLQAGDRVGIWAPNVAEWVFAALGAIGAGGVLVPLNTRFKGAEAAYVLERSGAKFLCTVTGFLDTDYVAMLRDAGAPGALDQIVVLQGDAPDGTLAFADFLARAGEVSVDDARARADAVEPDDVSDIIFTSGTTGKPKGAMTTHAQTLRTFDAWANTVGLTRGDRYLVVNPFFHTFGYKAGIIACFIQGATIVPEPVFNVPAVLAHVASERITMLPGPPTLYLSILDHPERDTFDLSSLRLAVTGAAAVPVEMIRRMREELTFRTIVTAYGLTESCGTVSICRADDAPETISHTSGRAIEGLEVRIVDDDGTEVPRGVAGEIVCRGYNVMVGYFEDEAATREAIDADGWLHTGDIGVMDERGYLQITDRKKDMFIVGGFNVYPAEVENAILAHPDVAQVAVVSAPDTRMGEVGVAFVVPRAGSTVDADELLAWCSPRMANYKVPRRAVVVDALPVNASGKVLKYELREQV
jgi:acyl-CoA synthetase (AMP-forming)/AMP-acid ligase II